MEELIHQFILVTQGMNVPPGEIYFGHENPKGELGFYINSRGGGTPYSRGTVTPPAAAERGGRHRPHF